MAQRKGHVPGGPQSGNLTPKATGAVAVPESTAPLAGDTDGDHPPFSRKRRPASKAKSIGDYVPRAKANNGDAPGGQGNGPGGNSSDPSLSLNWARLDPKKASQRVWQYVDKYESGLSWRHYMALRGAAAYSSVGLADMFENLSPYDGPAGNTWQRKGRKAFLYGGWGTKVNEAHARAAVETIVEKLTGLGEPKTQMVGTDLEWELRRQGIWADRFIEGNMHLPQQPFLDTWDLARQGLLISFCSTGTVAARVEPDYVTKRVRTQLRSTLNTFIDPGDVANGNPLSYFDITWENPEYMIEDIRYQGAKNAWKRDAIWKACEVPPQHNAGNYDGATFGTRMVKVVSAWRMPFGKFEGREAVFVKGSPAILWEDWEYPEPPLAFFRCNRCIGETFWGENFIEIMLNPLQDAEDIDDIAKRTMALTSQTNIALDGTTTTPAAMVNAKDVNFWRYDSKKNEKPPQIEKPGLLHGDYFNWRDRKIAIARELSGVPDMHLTSQSPGGTDSGRAKRLEASLLPERFARKLRNWNHWIAVEIATRQIRAARDIGEVEPNWQVTWPGADFDAKVSVKVLNIDETQFQLRPYAVSEQKNTPQERAAYAQELFDKKQISASQLSLILDGIYDTPKETKDTNESQRKLLARSMDDILHSDAKIVADENAYIGDRYTPPDPWTDPPSAIAQILPVYRQAMVDGVPQNRRNLLKRLIEDILAIQQQNAKDATMANASVSMKTTPGEAFPSAGQPGMVAPAGAPGPAPAPTDLGLGGAMGGAPAPINAGGPMGIA
jgi:hypothetical protein